MTTHRSVIRTFSCVLLLFTTTGISGLCWGNPNEHVTDAHRALEALQLIRHWRIEDARPKVADLLKTSFDNPLAIAVIGQLKFHLGDHVGAVEAFDNARRLGVPPSFLTNADAAEKARVATEAYVEHLGDHFIIRHPPGKDALLVPFAEEALEAARIEIGKLIGWVPKDRIVVEIYPTARTLASVSALTSKDIETSGTIALCRWNRLMITSPRAVVFGYAWRDTLAHELAHLIIGAASRDTAPIWLHEGLAKFTETSWRGKPGLGVSIEQQQKLREAVLNDKLITFEQMHPSMAKLPSQEAASLAFTEVFTFIEFLVERKGWAGIRTLLKTMAKNDKDIDRSLTAVYGAPLKKLEKIWKAALPERRIITPTGLRLVKGDRRLIVKDRPDTPDDDLHGLGQKARRFARAADLLYARGRYVAAQKELEKAFKESRSPLVSAKLATLALANNDLERAEQAARRSIESMPELAGPNVTLAEILLRRGERTKMKLPLARAIDINPFDPRIHQLTLAAEGRKGDPKIRDRAQRALEVSSLAASKEKNNPFGRGARIRVLGIPFSRVYLSREGKRLSTRLVTPTSVIELSPGKWTIELQPRGRSLVQREVSIEASDSVRTVRIEPAGPNTKASK